MNRSSNEPVALVPGLHLLGSPDETYLSAGLMRMRSACAAADLADPWIEEYVLVA